MVNKHQAQRMFVVQRIEVFGYTILLKLLPNRLCLYLWILPKKTRCGDIFVAFDTKNQTPAGDYWSPRAKDAFTAVLHRYGKYETYPPKTNNNACGGANTRTRLYPWEALCVSVLVVSRYFDIGCAPLHPSGPAAVCVRELIYLPYFIAKATVSHSGEVWLLFFVVLFAATLILPSAAWCTVPAGHDLCRASCFLMAIT